MSFRVDTYISPIMIRVCNNTARSKGQSQQNKHCRFLERLNEAMEFSINTAKLKGQRVKVNPVFPRNMSRHVGLNRFEPYFPRNVSRHIDPVCNMGLCASIRLVFLTLVSHCFAFHRNVNFFKCETLREKTQKKCIVSKLSG